MTPRLEYHCNFRHWVPIAFVIFLQYIVTVIYVITREGH